ncbi:ferritin-like domain-containing protein [Paraconexibacter antarcticus]|uniref:Ferritin-like domain-containing protein n=1 Tax=Paraconexibacter antarcticus TaxID=2949664 RepID=A0ABY5DXN6_9ACTN|nr:DUF892 family protein [Paraconexibacter antarcticus]UTI66088.1 ferritin-like domain-containing protein [Paraconexibacter antarcticus]
MAKSTTPIRDAVLVKYLNEAYGKEEQLQTALKAQIALAQRPTLKRALTDHLKVTKAQSRALKARIKALGGTAVSGPDLPGPDAVSDVATTAAAVANKAIATAKGPLQALRGTSPGDNQLRNVRDCFWNEAEEIAHYNVIEAAAEALGDKETAQLARRHRREEEKMQNFLAREIPKIVKDVMKDEVPKEERATPARRRTTTSRTSSATKKSTTSGRSTSTPARRRAKAAA